MKRRLLAPMHSDIGIRQEQVIAAALVSPFLFSACIKFWDFGAATSEMAGFNLPLPAITAVLVIGLQMTCSLAVLLDFRRRDACFALAVFTAAATILAHPFWSMTGSSAMREATTFFEHVALTAGLIFFGFSRRPTRDPAK